MKQKWGRTVLRPMECEQEFGKHGFNQEFRN